jgi:hypothetical protein
VQIIHILRDQPRSERQCLQGREVHVCRVGLGGADGRISEERAGPVWVSADSRE